MGCLASKKPPPAQKEQEAAKEELQDDEETKELIMQILQRIEGIRGKAEDYNAQLQLQVAEIENSKIGLLEEQPVRVNGIVTVAYEPESTTEDVPLFEAKAGQEIEILVREMGGWSYCRRIGDKTPGWLPADRIAELAQLIADHEVDPAEGLLNLKQGDVVEVISRHYSGWAQCCLWAGPQLPGSVERQMGWVTDAYLQDNRSEAMLASKWHRLVLQALDEVVTYAVQLETYLKEAKPEDRSADPEWMEKCMQFCYYLGTELQQITEALSQHGLSQSATGKYASTVVEVVGNSEHELSAAAGARVFIIDAENADWAWCRLEEGRTEGWLPRNVLIVEPGDAPDKDLPDWIKVGEKARWWSNSQKQFCDVNITAVDESARQVTVTFVQDTSCWKMVPFEHFKQKEDAWLLHPFHPKAKELYQQLPDWVRPGSVAYWWSTSQHRVLPVQIRDVCSRTRQVKVAFVSNKSVKKLVQFHELIDSPKECLLQKDRAGHTWRKPRRKSRDRGSGSKEAAEAGSQTEASEPDTGPKALGDIMAEMAQDIGDMMGPDAANDDSDNLRKALTFMGTAEFLPGELEHAEDGDMTTPAAFGLQATLTLPRSTLHCAAIMCGTRHLILLTFLATWPLTDASGNGGSCQSEDPSKAPSLLSLKADVLKAVDGMENENREHSLNGTVCSNCSNSTNSTNHSLEDLIKTVLEDDINQSNGMPDPVDADGTGGSLGKNLEFLYLKVAQLETAVELQSIELRFGRQELHQAQLEIQTLKDRLDHKDAALKQINSKLAKFQGEEPEPKLENKHRAAWLKQMEKNQKSKEEVGRRTQDLLMAVIKKHHRQTQRRWGAQETPASKTPKAPRGETKAELNEVMAQRAQSQHGATSDLDRSVASKGVPIVDDIVDAGEDLVDLVTDGTDLVGDALSDAYNQAADKVEFVANTVIDTVEQAVAILSQGFDFSANCPNWSGPSLSVSDSGLSVDWGRQRCKVTLVGQTLTLFDMNFGSTSVAYPAPLTAMISVGQQVSGCLSNGNALDVFKCTAKAIGDELLADVPAFKILFALAEHVAGCTGDALDVFACTAAKVGDVLLQKVPPFSILMNLGTMISEFVAFFAELASALIHTLLSETASLMQEAVNTSFPGVGEKPLQLAGPKGLTAHVRRQRGQQTPNRANKGSASKPSFLQRDANRKPSNDVDNGIVGFGTTEAQPYASMLITQFGGDEYDSGSCLAFAPSHRTGRTGNVTMRDWQVPSPDSDDFVKLEPWAVPCDNQWAKDNPSKWEGYSFYTYESVIEKCAAITYSMSAQPVMSFVGGLEFDLLPAPLMEITTEVCWPDRVSAPDLSLIVFTARSAGIVLFTHTIRLHRRFGSDTNFTSGNFKDSVERPRNYFGKGTGDDDDKALQVLSRTVEAQPLPTATASTTTVLKPALSQTNATEGPRHKPTRQSSPEEFEVKQQELFLASAKYDHRLGLNITARYEGAAAAKRVQAALSKKLSALQQDAGDLGVHELFELASPSGSLVGFSIKGELASGYLQLRVRINFGPVESPTKTIRLIDLVDNLRVVLAALPYVSQASKQKAIDAMSNTHFDSELPAAEFVGKLALESGVSQASGRVRDAVFERKDGICSVQAALKPTTWGTLATLPEDCRPSETLVFNLMTQDASMPASVEVNANGVVKWVEGSSDSWLSLSGLVFPALSPGWPIELSNGWSNAAAPYAGATYTLVGSLCFVEGRIVSGSTWGVLAQLSADCRPTKTLAFNLNVEGSATSQIEVHINGEVVYSAGPQVGWVSLSGIVFATATHAQKSLDLTDGWVATSGGDFGVPTYSLTHGYCLVEGRVDGTLMSGGGTLATLPLECWPMRKLIFSKAHGTTAMEVDVSEFGEISYSTDSDSDAVTVSLSGIMFSAPSDGLRLLPAVTPWTASIGGQWGEGVFVMKNGFCMVNARPQGGSFTSLTIIANLPEGCRPTKRLTFNLNHHDYTHSVDVTPDGSVVWMAGTGKYTWVSLTGITFAPGDLGRITLPLLNGWSAYGLEYGIPEVTKRNGICSVEGRLTGSSWSNLAQLPEDCTPSKRLIFNMNNLEQTSRVDVRDDGVIQWFAGGNSHNWISLAGMIIVPDESNAVPLELQNNWVHYGWSYGTATYVLVDGICVIQGMVKNGAKGTVVAVLPAECRPRERLTFNMNLKQSVARVDVLTSGSIRFQASGSWTTTWLSLSGIHFPI